MSEGKGGGRVLVASGSRLFCLHLIRNAMIQDHGFRVKGGVCRGFMSSQGLILRATAIFSMLSTETFCSQRSMAPM